MASNEEEKQNLPHSETGGTKRPAFESQEKQESLSDWIGKYKDGIKEGVARMFGRRESTESVMQSVDPEAKFTESEAEALDSVESGGQDVEAKAAQSFAALEQSGESAESPVMKELGRELNMTLLGKTAEGRYDFDSPDPTEQDAMRIIHIIENSDPNSLDLADVENILYILKVAEQRIPRTGPNRELYSAQAERFDKARDQILEQAVETGNAHWQTDEEIAATQHIPMHMQWTVLYHTGKNKRLKLNGGSSQAMALNKKAWNRYL